MHGYFSLQKVIIWSLQNEYFKTYTLSYWSQNLMGSWNFVLMTLKDTYWGYSLTHLILITASYLFLNQRPPWSLSSIDHLVQLEPGPFWFWFNCNPLWISAFWLEVQNLKHFKQYDKIQNTSSIPKTRSSKMLFIFHFYSLSIKTATLLESNRLVKTLPVFGKIIWLSDFMVSISKCGDLKVLHYYLSMLND